MGILDKQEKELERKGKNWTMGIASAREKRGEERGKKGGRKGILDESADEC